MEPTTPEPDEQAVRAGERVGTLIGEKWLIERVLGVGGMAAVYQAVHQHNQRKVALKILHDELCHFQDVRERFMQEAHAANRVGHRGAVPALDDGVLENGNPYLVLDFLEGQNLDRRWKKNQQRLGTEEVFAVAEQLLEILESAHLNGVLHRDIKPENIFLTTDGEVKLLDFGISKVTGVDRSHKTQMGSTMGTPAFMSPEQARGRWEELDARSDIFAVGATMYTLLSGETIHHADTANELLLKVMTEPVPPLRSVAPEVPEIAAQVINRAVSFDKSARFDNATEMKLAVAAVNAAIGRGLDSLLGNEEFGVRQSSIPPAHSSEGSTHRPVMSSDISFIEAERAAQRRRWATYGFAALMMLTASFSYLYFRSETPVEAITFSPVSGSEDEGELDTSNAQTNRAAPGSATTSTSVGAGEGVTLEEIEKENSKKRGSSNVRRSWVPRRPSPSTLPPQEPVAPEPAPAEPSPVSADEELEFDPLARRR